MSHERVIAYVDGFNLYHAIDGLNQPYLKWSNLWSVTNWFLRSGQTLGVVNYYSAYATWLPDAYAQHRQYVAALGAVGVSVRLSEFRERAEECYRCGNRWVAH